MADNVLIVQIDLEKGDTKTAFTKIEKDADKAGKKAGQSFSEGFSDSLKKAGIAAAAIAGVASVIAAKSVQAAAEQEEAVNRLNTALQTAGDFSQAASEDLQRYASQLQSVTTFGDELILNQLALAKSFGATNEQAKLVAQAAADLSAELGIDLESATRNVAKTLGGYAGELGETIPQLKAFTQEQLRAGAGVDFLAQRFAGAAARETQTFSGGLQQLSNTFGDLLERIGEIFTQSPVLVKLLNLIKSSFETLANSIQELNSEGDVFGEFIQGALDVNRAIIENVIAPLELLANISTFVFLKVREGLAGLVASLGFVGGKIGDLLSLIGVDAGQGLQNFAESSKAVFDEAGQSAAKAFESINEFPISSALEAKNQELAEALAVTNEVVKTSNDQLAEDLTMTTETVLTNQNELISAFGVTLSTSVAKTGEALKATQKQIAGIVKGGIARSVSQGIQSFIQAAAAGENAFEALGKSFLSTIGGLAIQLGEFFILEGIAVEALNAVSGTGAIAAGAALIALGSLLQAASGSGGGGSSSGGGGGGSSGAAAVAEEPSGLQETAAGEDTAIAEERTNVQLVVQGDIFNTDETARNLTDLLNDNFDTTGAALTNTRLV